MLKRIMKGFLMLASVPKPSLVPRPSLESGWGSGDEINQNQEYYTFSPSSSRMEIVILFCPGAKEASSPGCVVA